MADAQTAHVSSLAGLFLAVLVWWLCIQLSHDRRWRPEVAVMPRAIIDGDHVRITGFRNFDTAAGMTSR
jgi:hypothetical protein